MFNAVKMSFLNGESKESLDCEVMLHYYLSAHWCYGLEMLDVFLCCCQQKMFLFHSHPGNLSGAIPKVNRHRQFDVPSQHKCLFYQRVDHSLACFAKIWSRWRHKFSLLSMFLQNRRMRGQLVDKIYFSCSSCRMIISCRFFCSSKKMCTHCNDLNDSKSALITEATCGRVSNCRVCNSMMCSIRFKQQQH